MSCQKLVCSPGRTARILGIVAANLVLALALAAPVAAASRKTDPREVEARQAFAAGRYDRALDLFANLYGEKPHPTYLRNIGRCYQNLQQPDKAINAFRDYLRQAKQVKPAERREVEGYIAEMETLKQKQDEEAARAQAAATPPEPAPPEPAPPAPPPVPAGVDLTSPAPAPVAPPPPRFYRRAWFWAVVSGVAVAAVAGGLWAGGVFSKSPSACPTGYVCND